MFIWIDMKRLVLLFIMSCLGCRLSLANERPLNNELDYLYYHGLNELFLYSGTLQESELRIYYTGHKDYSFYVIPVTPGDTLRASAGVMQSTILLLKTKYDPMAPSGYLVCVDKPRDYLFKLKYSSITKVIPHDAHYMYVCNTINGDTVLPTELYIGRHNILEPKEKEIKYTASLQLKNQGARDLDYRVALSPTTVAEIIGEDVEFLDLPVMAVCSNEKQTIIIGVEAHCKSGVKWVTAISNDDGKTFTPMINYLRNQYGEIIRNIGGEPIIVPITELLYDKKNERILSLTASFCYASDDFGETWYQMAYFGNSIHRPEQFNHTMYCPTTGIQLSNGVLVAPMRFFQKDENSGKLVKSVNFIIYSKDYGKTWEQSPTTPEDIICDEALVVEYKKNQVMINARGGTEFWMEKTNNGRRVFVPVAKSSNRVNKWKIRSWKIEKVSDGQLYDPICNAAILRLPKEIKKGAVFTNPYIPGEYWPRKNLLLRYTKDYKHWDNLSLLTPYGERLRGYSALAASRDNVYFAYVNNEGQVLFCSIVDAIKGL